MAKKARDPIKKPCTQMTRKFPRFVIMLAQWDLKPRQLAGIILEFNGLTPNEKKGLVEYAEAVLKFHEEKSEPKKPKKSLK